MNDDRLAAIMQAAMAEDLLPLTASPPEIDSRPWPVVLLIGLGAWLATIPLLIAVGLLLGEGHQPWCRTLCRRRAAAGRPFRVVISVIQAADS